MDVEKWVEENEKICNQASPGPWHIGHVSEAAKDPNRIGELADVDDSEGCLVAEVEWRRDQSFLCKSRMSLPIALELIKKYRATLLEIESGNGFFVRRKAEEALNYSPQEHPI